MNARMNGQQSGMKIKDNRKKSHFSYIDEHTHTGFLPFKKQIVHCLCVCVCLSS